MEVMLSRKKILQIIVFSIFFLFIIVYAFFRSQDLIFGIKIKNVSINGSPAQSGIKVMNSVVEVTGNAKNAINLALNGREISIDKSGNFKETIAPLSGYNIINITVKDKFGYVDEKNYQIMH